MILRIRYKFIPVFFFVLIFIAIFSFMIWQLSGTVDIIRLLVFGLGALISLFGIITFIDGIIKPDIIVLYDDKLIVRQTLKTFTFQYEEIIKINTLNHNGLKVLIVEIKDADEWRKKQNLLVRVLVGYNMSYYDSPIALPAFMVKPNTSKINETLRSIKSSKD